MFTQDSNLLLRYFFVVLSVSILFLSCKTTNKSLIKVSSCEQCLNIKKKLFINYPCLNYEVGEWISIGYNAKPRNIPAMRKRATENDCLRIVDEKKFELLNSLRFCLIGLDSKIIDGLFDKNIKRVCTIEGDELELAFDFDFGKVEASKAYWYQYTRATFKFKKFGRKYIFVGGISDKRAYDTCGKSRTWRKDTAKKRKQERESRKKN